MTRLHFISGLPRSGSTLLAAILRQNPRVSAGMSGPVFGIFLAVQKAMSLSHNSFALHIKDDQRMAVLKSVVEAFYATCAKEVVFDTNRGWCGALPILTEIFPEARIICCVRNPAWILDSFERLVQRNSLRQSRIFPPDSDIEFSSVFNRVDALMKQQVGGCLNSLRQAWFGDQADRLIAVRYESLSERPGEVIHRLYDLLGEEPFHHDFENVNYQEPEFDDLLETPGLHDVRTRVTATTRETILPPEIFTQYDRSWWDMPGQNPRAVIVL